MNNKKLGTEFEKEFVNVLNDSGYWVHFITPNNSGAQPFDIIAVKDGISMVFDCKTSSKRMFPITRLEDNQIYAFEKWLACGNTMPMIAIKYNDCIKIINYDDLKREGSIDIENYCRKKDSN